MTLDVPGFVEMRAEVLEQVVGIQAAAFDVSPEALANKGTQTLLWA